MICYKYEPDICTHSCTHVLAILGPLLFFQVFSPFLNFFLNSRSYLLFEIAYTIFLQVFSTTSTLSSTRSSTPSCQKDFGGASVTSSVASLTGMYMEGKKLWKSKSTTTAIEMAVTGGACHNDQACMTHVPHYHSWVSVEIYRFSSNSFQNFIHYFDIFCIQFNKIFIQWETKSTSHSFSGNIVPWKDLMEIIAHHLTSSESSSDESQH